MNRVASVNGSERNRRSALVLGACALVVLALTSAACTRENGPYAADASTLRVLYDGDERQLFAGLRFPTQFLLFVPLVAHDGRHEIEGRLARTWTHSDDYREWTFHLRTDVRWHDGVAVTAHDVKFTFELFDAMWGTARGAGVTVRDDSTFTIRHARPTDALDWWMVYYPRHLLERLDPAEFEDWHFWQRPVGNGPYRFVRHVPETLMEFEANPNHYRGEPRIERVVLKFVGQAGLMELLAGGQAHSPFAVLHPGAELHVAHRRIRGLVERSRAWMAVSLLSTARAPPAPPGSGSTMSQDEEEA